MNIDADATEGQLCREGRIAGLVEMHCPGLILHSRTGRGELRSCLPRLRFDRFVAFGWFWNLFLSAKEKAIYSLAFTVTGEFELMLDLASGYRDIEIHLYDHSFLKQLERFAVAYRTMTGKMASIIMEAEKRIPHRRPMFRFALFVCALAIVVIGLRLCSFLFADYLFRNFP